MQYIEHIIQEELKKKINEGFFDKFRMEEKDPKKAQMKRINDSLEAFKQSMINVSANVNRYGQTVQNYHAVKCAGEIEHWIFQQIAKISNGVNSLMNLKPGQILPYVEGTPMISEPTNGEEEQVRPQPQIPPQMPMTQEREDDSPSVGESGMYAPGDPTNIADTQIEEEPFDENAVEYVRRPKVKIQRDHTQVVWFEGGSIEEEPGSSVYKIFPSEESPDMGQFELIDDDIVRQLVTTAIEDYLAPCCKGNVVVGARRIVTRERGQVEYRDEKWYVTKKAVIEFIK